MRWREGKGKHEDAKRRRKKLNTKTRRHKGKRLIDL
jgi:hypothetical protein